MDTSHRKSERASFLPTFARANDEDSTTHPPIELSRRHEDSAMDAKEPKSYAAQLPESSRASGSANRRRTSVRWLYWWGWELGACFGSLIAFIAMVVLLKSYEGKAQPEWPYGITLNSAISWLNTMMKGMLLVPAAACISQSTWIYYGGTLESKSKGRSLGVLSTYDSASRGPWGSVQLLWALRGRRLACLGALLTVLAIGMDPSVQQTIVVRTRMVDSMQETRIPRSQYFVQYSDYETGTVSQPVLGLVGALYNGLYSAGSGHNISDVTPSCPTGNCQYPLFQSLAFCGSCENATSTMKTTCSEAFAEDYEQDFIYCQFKLPNGVQVNASHSSHQYDDADFNPEANLTIVGTGVDYDVVDPMGPNGSVLDYTVMKALIESNRTGISRASPLDAGISVTADRCKLRFCVNTYESSVTDGQLTEKTLSTWDLGSAKIQWNGNLTLRPPSANNNTDETFLIGENAADTLISWLYNKTRTSNSVGVNRYFGRESDGRFYSEEMTLLLAKADTTDIFRDLAKTLTIYLRTLGDNQKLPHEYIGESLPYNGPVKGTAYELQAYVAIRWVWLAYPAALLALTQIFFILVVAQSAMNGTAVWKSSPLALLFHGLSGLSVQQEQRCDAMDLREMDETAKGIKVRLQEARLVVVEK